MVTGGMGGLGETICVKMAQAGTVWWQHALPAIPGPRSGLPRKKLRVSTSLRSPWMSLTTNPVPPPALGLLPKSDRLMYLLIPGITRDMTFKKMSKADWDAVMHVNLDGLFNMTKPVLDGMVERGWGRIINGSSVNAQKGAFGQTNYSAAKAGIHGFTKALALEVARQRCHRQYDFSRLYWHEDGHRDTQRDLGDQDPPANPSRPAREAGGSRWIDHLFGIGRSCLRDGRQHRDKRRAAYAVTERPVFGRRGAPGPLTKSIEVAAKWEYRRGEA